MNQSRKAGNSGTKNMNEFELLGVTEQDVWIIFLACLVIGMIVGLIANFLNR